MARSITGTVTSDKADKTIVITVRTRKTHPVYKKQYTLNTKFMAHDEKNEAKVGDLVIITETRPLSARKHFMLNKIIERSGVRFEETDAVADIAEEQVIVEQVQVAKPDSKSKKTKEESEEEAK
jgi:small subunit ribosomal protein S17